MFDTRPFLEAIPVGALVWSPSGGVWPNSAFATMLGYGPGEQGVRASAEAVARYLQEIHGTPERLEALRHGEQREPVYSEVRHRSGNPVPVMVIPSFWPGPPEETALLAVVVDLRPRLEQERREKIAIVGRWAAGAAHDLRTPIAAVKMALQAIERRPDRAPELIAEALRQLARVDRMMQNLLFMAKPQLTELQPVSAWDLLLAAVAEVQERAEAQNVRLYLPALRAADGPPPVVVHPPLMQQAFKYLLDNALDALAEGGIVLLDWTVVDGRLRLDVCDSGLGIGEGLRARVFEAFFSTKPEGLGLGLTLCQDIVQAHGGEVEIAPGPAGGLRASVILPLAGAPAPGAGAGGGD